MYLSTFFFVFLAAFPPSSELEPGLLAELQALLLLTFLFLFFFFLFFSALDESDEDRSVLDESDEIEESRFLNY